MVEIICKANSILEYDSEFDLIKTMSSGQSFRWAVVSSGIEVHHVNKSVVLSQNKNKIKASCTKEEFKSVWENYFDLNNPYNIPDFGDEFIKECIRFGSGLHLLKQDLWETVVAFILSQRSSIPKTTLSINRLCELSYGEFPTPEFISVLSQERLARETGCGYRAKYLIESAKFYSNNKRAMEQLHNRATKVQEEFLLKMHGVGEKVAECIMLFGLNNTEVFPVDVWIERIIDEKYNGAMPMYKYGKYAGIIQQYAYYYAINHKAEFMA